MDFDRTATSPVSEAKEGFTEHFRVLMKMASFLSSCIFIILQITALWCQHVSLSQDGAQEILVLKQMMRKNQTAFETRTWRWTRPSKMTYHWKQSKITPTRLIAERGITSDKNAHKKVKEWNAAKHFWEVWEVSVLKPGCTAHSPWDLWKLPTPGP